MNTASWIAFRDLLERCERDKKAALMHYLSREEQEKLGEVSSPEQNPFVSCLSTEQRIANVHWSWLIPFLEPFAEKDKLLILSALDKVPAEKLRKQFKISKPLPSPSSHGLSYLHSAIYHWLISDQKGFIPLEFLPQHPLNGLLTLSKSELQILINYLGLHDLAVEFKHIIKAEQIKKIQKVLTTVQQDFLKSLLKGKEPLSFTRLNLDSWNGDEEKLRSILHYRGFNRLGKALFGCHPSLLWHICHTLDTGRTKILKKFFTDINNMKIQELLVKQVLELIPMVQKKNE
ncbi:MAG: hypothetical protein K1060chlam2_01074 [Chlamydiae bacterium]|nr:hypothetical protein [Chlamydiota bacterium]